MSKLNRFLKAQDNITFYKNTVFEQALKELEMGYLKIHCWIRYLFPQIKGLGKSSVTKYYELDGREEAYAYMEHPILSKRLIEATEAVLNNEKSAYEIFGSDVVKFRSCMLLFSTVSDNPVFKQVIQKYKW
jgi:uncharacterized protein (DUF1810 family)